MRCLHGHAYDVAKEGYVNLLLAQHRKSKDPGYNEEMITARRDFFDSGAYAQLATELAKLTIEYVPDNATFLDAGCGEGYYVRQLRRELGADTDATLVGLDISKHGIKIAAKRDPLGSYAVASSYSIPLAPKSVDVLLTHFSPVSADAFRKVVKPGGIVMVSGPGEQHLAGLRELVYDDPTPHEPEELLANEPGFTAVSMKRIRHEIFVEGHQNVYNLLKMTPYFWTVGGEKHQKLSELDSLVTPIDVVIHCYRLS